MPDRIVTEVRKGTSAGAVRAERSDGTSTLFPFANGVERVGAEMRAHNWVHHPEDFEEGAYRDG